jgi:hypothetical protein
MRHDEAPVTRGTDAIMPLDTARACDRLMAAALLGVALLGGGVAHAADPASDAPEAPRATNIAYTSAESYARALTLWRTPEDVNAWIGAKFEYDRARAILLSETQRAGNARLAIHRPDALFDAPRGVCVDLARFGVETLRAIAPALRPSYLMIEFAPVSVAGNTLRLHWVASYRRDGAYYVYADSKRPGHVAGPYATLADFIAEYAGYRGREIVAYRERESYQRQARTPATRQQRETRAP